MKCPDFLLKAFAKGETADCWCWNGVKKNGMRGSVSQFDVLCEDDRPFYTNGEEWFEHAEPYEENYKEKHMFKPLDPVLIRDIDKELWRLAFFDRYSIFSDDGIMYITIGGEGYRQCIMYETHKELKDTTNEPTDIE